MAIGDILSCTIRSDGWSADLVIQGFATGATYNFGLGTDNDPSNCKVVFTVVSLGFDITGTATTVTRTLYGTSTVRLPYPSEAAGSTGPGSTKDESIVGGNLSVRISLSDFVYAKDNTGAGNSGTGITATIAASLVTNSGGAGQTSNAISNLAITNNSTLAYPKVVGRWAWPGFERITGDFLIEALCFNRFARNGKPVACVKFDCADASGNSVAQQNATSMNISTRVGDAKSIAVYSATIPVSGLHQGDVLTCRFRAYPWVGDSSSTLDTDPSADGIAAPSEHLSPLMQLLDKNNALAVYASVDGTNGTSGGSCSSTQAGARLAPFQTLAQAFTALKAFNNTNHSDNSLNNCVVLMQNGSYTGPGTFTGSNTKSRCVVMADIANGATESGVILSTATNTAFAAYLKLQDVTLSTTGTGLIRGSTTAGIVWLHSCTINSTGTAPVYQWQICEATQNTVTAMTGGFILFSTTKGPWGLVRGNDCTGASSDIVADWYCVIGNSGRMNAVFNETGSSAVATAGEQISDNAIFAYNQLAKLTNPMTDTVGAARVTTVSIGLAVVGNVAEKTSITTPLMQIAGDSTTSVVNNVMIWHNTTVGTNTTAGRSNLGYNETGTVGFDRKNWSIKFNSGDQYNNKDDTFTGNSDPEAARVGSWPVGYEVGCEGNVWYDSLFLPEFNGLYSKMSATRGYTNQLASSGGGGDYSLTSGSDARNRIVTGHAVIPFDLIGNAFNNNGYGSAGAYQRINDIPTIGRRTSGIRGGSRGM
jgi:hypothetical protein